MSQAHAAALQASAARAAAAEKESSVIGWNNVDDESMRANKIARLEIELYKTIIVRESLVGRAASLAAALMSGDKKALGTFNPQLLEDNQHKNNESKFSPGNLRSSIMHEQEQEMGEPGLLEVLDQLRMATVNTVEAVVKWQMMSAENARLKIQSRPNTATSNKTDLDLAAENYPAFVWNGRNYLIKIATDIDFLDGIPHLHKALGFSLIKNPFVLPGGLQNMPTSPPEIPVVVPTLSAIPSHIIAAASGGKALDSVRLFHAANAVRKEDRQNVFEALQDGLIQTSTMLPDWNSPDLAKQAIAWPSPPVVREKDKDLSMRMIGNVPHVQDTSSLALMDAEKRLKHGLGIDMQGRPLNGSYGAPQDSENKNRMEGAPYMMSEKDLIESNAAWAESRGMNSRREKGLHPSDYAAVKRKTGISRTDLSSMAAYTVPPAGVKLALEAIFILLYPNSNRNNGRKKRKKQDSQGVVPRSKVELEWPALQRMAADREHLLRCLLQFREGVALHPEKEQMLASYVNDKLFNEDLLTRQSQGAGAICAYIKQVFESAIRAKERYGAPVSDNLDGRMLEDVDQFQDPLWGHENTDHETADVEQDAEDSNVARAREKRKKLTRPRSQGTAAGMLALKEELVKLRQSLTFRGILSDGEGDKQASFQEEKVREDKNKLSPKGKYRRPQRGTEGTTLLRVGYRVKNYDEETVGSPTTYIVLTFLRRHSDGWLNVDAYEPGGAGSAQTQLHPTYCQKLLNMSLEDIASLPKEGCEQRMQPLLEKLRASHGEPKDVVGEAMEDARANGDDNKLHLHFEFPRDVFTGAKRVRKKNMSREDKERDISKTETMMMRVEITDGSGTPRRRRLKDEDGGLLIVAWHHKNKKHHALQLRRRELLFTICSSRAFIECKW